RLPPLGAQRAASSIVRRSPSATGRSVKARTTRRVRIASSTASRRAWASGGSVAAAGFGIIAYLGPPGLPRARRASLEFAGDGDRSLAEELEVALPIPHHPALLRVDLALERFEPGPAAVAVVFEHVPHQAAGRVEQAERPVVVRLEGQELGAADQA